MSGHGTPESRRSGRDGGCVTLTGTSADGIAVCIEGHDHYPAARVWVNGLERKVLHAARLRDGGTTTYVVEGGTLTLPHRIGSTDRTPRWEPS